MIKRGSASFDLKQANKRNPYTLETSHKSTMLVEKVNHDQLD